MEMLFWSCTYTSRRKVSPWMLYIAIVSDVYYTATLPPALERLRIPGLPTACVCIALLRNKWTCKFISAINKMGRMDRHESSGCNAAESVDTASGPKRGMLRGRAYSKKTKLMSTAQTCRLHHICTKVYTTPNAGVGEHNLITAAVLLYQLPPPYRCLICSRVCCLLHMYEIKVIGDTFMIQEQLIRVGLMRSNSLRVSVLFQPQQTFITYTEDEHTHTRYEKKEFPGCFTMVARQTWSSPTD